MTTDTIRVLIGSGFFMLLLFLRLEANRFGAAEFDEPDRRSGGPWMRVSWYLIGLALLAALYVVHPSPHDVLFLLAGHRNDVIFYGTILALLGLGQAAAFAWFHYSYLRLPPARAYPGAAVNSIATAVIDEATFRGALLGTLVAIGLPATEAVVVATLAYVLATRMPTHGAHLYMLLLACGIGVVCGWATLASGGLGAAIFGHAVTSFAVFVCTGHAGRVPSAGREPEELELRTHLPEGWQDARRPLVAGRGAEPRGFAEQIGPSGFADRADRRAAQAQHSGGPMAWLRSMGRNLAQGGQRPRH
jgi:hypothetical protein